MTAEKQSRTLIVGQGLAGTLLAWQMLRLGQELLIVDREETLSSSKTAGGIVTPITGMRMVKTWRLDDFYPTALEFYRWMEKETGETLYHEIPVQRLFQNAEEREQFTRRMQEPGFSNYVIEEGVPDSENLQAAEGGFLMRGGYLEVARFLKVSREHFENQGAYLSGEVPADSLEILADKVRWKEHDFSQLVFCEGWAGSRNPYFDWIPFKPAKGEVLEIRCEGLGDQRILNRGGFIAPLRDGCFRAGSTYEWEQLDQQPTREGENEIGEKIRGITRLPFEIIDHKAGVRPIISGSKALLGRHPGKERLAFFNGLGSKGVLNGPWLSSHLAQHLVHGSPIDEAVDLRKNI